jgi:hypothetical protein
MTDLLEVRFAALADRADDSDWLDVRRRARRRTRRFALPMAAAGAAIVAAAALGAGGTWLFSSHDRQVTAVTHVSLHGQSWRIVLTTHAGSWLSPLCVTLSRPGVAAINGGCRGWALSRIGGPTFGARHFEVEGGQIWTGATVPFARQIVITDTQGIVHSTRAIAAPRGTKTSFRYWAIALDARARSIAVYGEHGRVLTKRL